MRSAAVINNGLRRYVAESVHWVCASRSRNCWGLYNDDFYCVHPCVHDFFTCTADMVTTRANTQRIFSGPPLWSWWCSTDRPVRHAADWLHQHDGLIPVAFLAEMEKNHESVVFTGAVSGLFVVRGIIIRRLRFSWLIGKPYFSTAVSSWLRFFYARYAVTDSRSTYRSISSFTSSIINMPSTTPSAFCSRFPMSMSEHSCLCASAINVFPST